MSNNLLQIVNLVASGKLGIGEVDVIQIAKDINSIDVTAQPGQVYIKSESIPTIILYKSGRFSVAGAKGFDDVEAGSELLVNLLLDLGIDISPESVSESISVDFIVFQGDLGQHLNLTEVVDILPAGRTEYEPEQFPAIIYRPNESDSVVTIFSTGKISISGVRKREDAEQIYYKINQSLVE